MKITTRAVRCGSFSQRIGVAEMPTAVTRPRTASVRKWGRNACSPTLTMSSGQVWRMTALRRWGSATAPAVMSCSASRSVASLTVAARSGTIMCSGLSTSRSFTAAPSGVARHPPGGRRRLPGDEPDHRLGHRVLHEVGGLLLVGAPDLSDHDHRVGLGVRLKGRETVDEVRADERVAADPHAGGLTQALRRQLVHDLVRQRSAARHHAHPAGPADVAGDDPHLAPARGDEPGAVGTDQPRAALLQIRQDARHVQDRDSLRDADDERDAGVCGFEDRGGGDGGRDVDHGGIRLGLAHRVGDGVEHGDHTVEPLPAFAGRDPGHDLGAVGDHLPRVKRPVATGDTLHHQAGLLINEDAHATAFAWATARFTASSMSVSAENPACVRICTASSSLVPVSRMTIGTLSGNVRVAWTMPLATSSHRVMPPKMLNRMARTLASAVMIWRALTTFCGFELPPMSRKLAGSPP